MQRFCSIIKLFSYSVSQLFSYSIIKLLSYSVIQLFSYQIIFAQTEIPETSADSIPVRDIYSINPSSRWMRELRNIIIVSPRNETTTDTFNIESPGMIYLDMEGLTIVSIKVVRLKPFGTSIATIPENYTDSEAYINRDLNWLSKAGNATHVNTNERIIRNSLMFKEGDVIDGFNLAYTERYLRSLIYIGDARINVIAVSDTEAEVIVTVLDVFPYTVDFGTNFETRSNLSLTNNNIVGLGFELQGGIFADLEKDHLMGYRATARASNIKRSFVSFQADYLDKYESQYYGVNINRDFYTPATKYAGHLILFDHRTPARYFDPQGILYPVLTRVSIRYKHRDAWFGRSFQMSNNKTNNEKHKNFTVSLRTQYIHYLDRPEQSQNHYYRFQNKTTYLASLTWSQQAFYKTSLIYNFGQTEDIPYGEYLSVIAGREVNEMYVRPYIGVNYAAGYFVPKYGYLSGSFKYGTFFNKGADQGILDVQMNYFTNLYVLRNYRLRTFVNGHYTGQLFNRLEDQLIIEGDKGIPGFRNDSVLGRHRFNLSAEQYVFMPREIYGFRFAAYVFCYLSWLGDYNETILFSDLYSSFGLGVRVRNNRLIINTIQLQFAYFPNIPKNSRFRYVELSREKIKQPRDFMPRAPEVMPLN